MSKWLHLIKNSILKKKKKTIIHVKIIQIKKLLYLLYKMPQDPLMKSHQELGNVNNSLANTLQWLDYAAISASMLR